MANDVLSLSTCCTHVGSQRQTMCSFQNIFMGRSVAWPRVYRDGVNKPPQSRHDVAAMRSGFTSLRRCRAITSGTLSAVNGLTIRKAGAANDGGRSST